MKKTVLSIFAILYFMPILAQKVEFSRLDTLYLYFEHKKSTLSRIQSNEKTLKKLLELLKDNPVYKLAIVGNCDDHEKAQLKNEALTLSVARAVNVKNWFISKGIKACRLRMDAGEAENPVLEINDKNRRFNRRVDCAFFLEEYNNITLKSIPDTIKALDSLRAELVYYPEEITPENARVIAKVLDEILSKNPNWAALICRFDTENADYKSRAAFLFEYLSEKLKHLPFYFHRDGCRKNILSIKIYENSCLDTQN